MRTGTGNFQHLGDDFEEGNMSSADEEDCDPKAKRRKSIITEVNPDDDIDTFV